MHSLAFTQPTFSSRPPRMPLLSYSFPCFLSTTFLLLLLLLVLQPPPHPVSLCLLSPPPFPQLNFSPPAACPRALQKEGDPGRRHRFAPGRASNLIIRRLIIREKGTKITRVQLFSPESFRSPFIGDLMCRSIACRARICADLPRSQG